MAWIECDDELLASFAEQFHTVRQTMDQVAAAALEASMALPPIAGASGQKLINALTKLANDWDELARRRDEVIGGGASA